MASSPLQPFASSSVPRSGTAGVNSGTVTAIILVALAGVALAGASAPQRAPQPAATAAISGTVTDGVTGRPLGAVIVAIRAPSTGAPLARIVRVVTDEQGRFVIRDLPA